MAIKELNDIAVFNVKIKADGTGSATGYALYPGMVLSIDPATGLADAAARGTNVTNPGNVLGILADYTGAISPTDIYIDPVGSTTVDPTTGLLVDNSNASYAAPRRQAFSYNYAEQINNVTNFTAGAGGSQGPMRPVAYYVAPAQLQVDSSIVIAFKTGDTNSTTFADTADTTGYTAGDLLTFGTTTNAGKLIKVVAANNFGGYPIARIDRVNSSAGLYDITLL